MEWGLRSSHEKGSAVRSVGDHHLIAWGDLRPSTKGYALTVWWPRRQGVVHRSHRIEPGTWGAEHVVVTSEHRKAHLAKDRADAIVQEIHQLVVSSQRARLTAALAELDGQSSDANQSRTDDGTRPDASRGGAASGGTSATGASG